MNKLVSVYYFMEHSFYPYRVDLGVDKRKNCDVITCLPLNKLDFFNKLEETFGEEGKRWNVSGVYHQTICFTNKEDLLLFKIALDLDYDDF